MIAARVLGETDAPGVKARDTADRDTPAACATSRKVTAIYPRDLCQLLGAKSLYAKFLFHRRKLPEIRSKRNAAWRSCARLFRVCGA
jgi:hypothetical protein